MTPRWISSLVGAATEDCPQTGRLVENIAMLAAIAVVRNVVRISDIKSPVLRQSLRDPFNHRVPHSNARTSFRTVGFLHELVLICWFILVQIERFDQQIQLAGTSILDQHRRRVIKVGWLILQYHKAHLDGLRHI